MSSRNCDINLLTLRIENHRGRTVWELRVPPHHLYSITPRQVVITEKWIVIENPQRDRERSPTQGTASLEVNVGSLTQCNLMISELLSPLSSRHPLRWQHLWWLVEWTLMHLSHNFRIQWWWATRIRWQWVGSRRWPIPSRWQWPSSKWWWTVPTSLTSTHLNNHNRWRLQFRCHHILVAHRHHLCSSRANRMEAIITIFISSKLMPNQASKLHNLNRCQQLLTLRSKLRIPARASLLSLPRSRNLIWEDLPSNQS